MTDGAIRLVVDGTPRGKGRPRFDSRRRRPAYTDDETAAHEAAICAVWFSAGRPRFDGQVALTIAVELVVDRPLAHWRKSGSLSAAGERMAWPFTRKPDVDNALKLAMDALNGKAYGDDVQICRASVTRRWCNPAEGEHTVITVRPLQSASMLRSAA